MDFKDIQDAILEEMKIQSSDTVSLARIKRVINEIYINEVIPYARWKWLEGHVKLKFREAYTGGTASVSLNSATVTLSTAPAATYGSFTGYFFSVSGHNEVYIIDSHTAEGTAITLTSQFLGAVDSAATFKIWTDKVPLPTDCRETVTVWHNQNTRPMEAMGWQKFRELTIRAPKAEGYPRVYNTGDYKDPSSGTDEYESDRYREMRVHPAIYNTAVTISVDYIKEVTALSADGDEPVLPIEDRIVLKYGALATLWRTIGRNPEEAGFSMQEFQNKLQRMAGKVEDSHDKPQIHPDSQYIRRRRASRYRIGGFSSDMAASGGGGNSSSTQFLQNVTIQGARLSADMTVDTGITIDGVDISVLEDDFAAHLVDTSDAHTAIAITNSPSGNLAATTVQGALDELQLDVDTRALDSALTAHISDTTDAHAASAISNTPSGNLAATDVQTALNELQTDIDTRALASGLSDHLADIVDAHDASAISFSPVGTIAATDAQTAIAEVATDAASALSTHESDTTSIHGIADTSILVTTTGTQVLTAKDIDGGTASNTSRLTVPKASKATIDALTRKQATLVYASDQDKLYYDNGSLLKAVGSGSGGGAKNYLSEVVTTQSSTANTGNGDFELGATTGWSLGTIGTLTNGLPTGTPTFGSGASGNLSISVVSTSHLAGTYSLSYASSAATTQGNMVASSAFYIDNEDQAKCLQYKFYFKAQTNPTNANWSGTSSNSYGMAVYDVTNSVWLAVSNPFAINQSSGIGVAIGQIQTNYNTTQLRFCVYNMNATSGAVTIYLDDFSVSPCDYVYGTPITDWVAYTPTFGVGFGTVTSPSFFSRRAGDSLEVIGKWTNGTVASNTASITLGYGGGNANVTIDTAKAGTNSIIGSAQTSLASTTHFGVYPITPSSNGTAIFFTVQNSTTGFSSGAALGATISASSSQNSVSIRVPIVGWSSSVQVSDGYDGRLIAAFAHRASTSQNINSASDIKIQWNGKTKDTTASFDSTTNYRFTAPSQGIYRHSGVVILDPSSSNIATLYLYKNGSTNKSLGSVITSATVPTSIPFSFELDANAGDYFELYLNSNSVSQNVVSDASAYGGSQWYISKLQAPTTMSATEVVAARYSGVTTGSIGAAANLTTYPTKDFDTHNAYSSGIYTVPAAGLYQISASNEVSGTESLDQVLTISVFKNGSATAYLDMRRAPGTVSTTAATGSTLLNLVAGDLIGIRIYTTIGSPSYTSAEILPEFTIFKVK